MILDESALFLGLSPVSATAVEDVLVVEEQPLAAHNYRDHTLGAIVGKVSVRVAVLEERVHDGFHSILRR